MSQEDENDITEVTTTAFYGYETDPEAEGSSSVIETSGEPVTELVTEPDTEPETTAYVSPYDVSAYDSNITPLADLSTTTMPDCTRVLSQYRETSQPAIINNMPSINIVTEDGVSILSKETYVASVVNVFNCADEYALTATAGVRVRGNASAEGDEKPYRIKFEKKQSMLGLHDGQAYKSWVLLRTYHSLIQDYMAFKLGTACFEGNYYSSDAILVDLYINGVYKGVYLLCEQNQVGKDRFAVNEPKADETSVETGYLLEVNNYVTGDDHYNFTLSGNDRVVTDINGESRTIYSHFLSIKSDINTEGQYQFISNYMNGVFEILYQASQNNAAYMFNERFELVSAEGILTPQEAVEAVIDTESLAGMIIHEELCHNYDVGAGSQYMAIDFSQDSVYKKVTFCGPWDYSWAFMGATEGAYYACTFQELRSWGDNSNIWYILAMRMDWFRDLLKQKWVRTYDSIVATNQAAADYISGIKADLAITGNSNKVEIGLHDVVGFVEGRIKWLDSQWRQ